MALDKPTLKTALEVAFGANTVGLNPAYQASIQAMAQQVADAIDTFVKSGIVNTVDTIPVTSTPGTPSVGTGVGSVT